MPVSALRELQLERLRKIVRRLWTHVPYYRQKMQVVGVRPSDIRTLEDIRKLPFTTKEDLRLCYPYDAFAVPLDKVIRIHASSGTTGKSTVVGYTRKDMDTWTNLVARFLVAGGLTSKDVVHIAFSYGLFTGGFGLHYGAERVGAAVIPVSAGRTERQITIMKDFGSTALVCTPSYAIYLAEVMHNSGIDRDTLKLRLGYFGGVLDRADAARVPGPPRCFRHGQLRAERDHRPGRFRRVCLPGRDAHLRGSFLPGTH